MNYDTWKAHDPRDDDDYRGLRCATPHCENVVTFPDFEVYCSLCLLKQGERRTQLKAQLALTENRIRR